MCKEEFTVNQGLDVQARNLRQWKSVLKPAKYKQLVAHIKEVNAHTNMRSGMDVFRGNDIDVWVSNNLMDDGYPDQSAEPRLFSVEVCRVGYGFATIEVMAISQEDAEEKALDEAGDHEYSEKSSEYSIAD
jgi:hypothetical protein